MRAAVLLLLMSPALAADVTSKEPYAAGMWLLEEVGPDQRAACYSDIPMSTEALTRLIAIMNVKLAQLKKGALVVLPPPPVAGKPAPGQLNPPQTVKGAK